MRAAFQHVTLPHVPPHGTSICMSGWFLEDAQAVAFWEALRDVGYEHNTRTVRYIKTQRD